MWYTYYNNGVVDMSDMSNMLIFFTNAGFSVSSICICLSILFAYFLKNREKKFDERNRNFIFYLSSIIIMSLVEIVCVLYFIKFGVDNDDPILLYYMYSLATLFAIFSAWRFVVSYRYIVRKESGLKEINRYIPYSIIGFIEIVLAGLVFVLPIHITFKGGIFTFEGLSVSLILLYTLVSTALFTFFVYYKNKNVTSKDSLPIIISLIILCSILVIRIVTGIDVNIETFQLTVFALGLFFTVENQDNKLLSLTKQKQDSAQKATQSQKDFLANLSHEIRSPMNTILGYSQLLLQEENITKEGIHDDMVNIHDTAVSLLSLINNITDFSYLISEKEEVLNEDYTIQELLIELNNNVINIAANKNVNIDYVVNENVPKKLRGDLPKIVKIIYDVLCNAISFSNNGHAVLEINGNKIDDSNYQFEFSVKTDGSAMQEELFDINSTDFMALNYEGTVNSDTLGLLVAKNLSEILNAKLEFKKEAGNGSMFSLVFNQDIIDASPVGVEINNFISSLNVKLNLTGKRILVVDNNDNNNIIIKRLLDKYNSTVEICTSGREAIDRVTASQYDAIFMEYIMPGLDGNQTLTKIKEYATNVPPAIAFVDKLENVGKGRQTDSLFYDYLAKPINYTDLNRILFKLFYEQNTPVQNIEVAPSEGGVSNV